MHWLRWSGHQVISLKQAYEALFKGVSLPTRSVVISFDDGFQDFYDYAFPVLQEFGYPSIVYVVAGLIGQPAKWLAEGDRAGDETIMSAEILRIIHKGQVEIGAHTMSHAVLPKLSATQQAEEIGNSKRVLEEVLGEAIESFAYPYGVYNPGVRDAVAAAGFKTGLTVNRGLANLAPNPYEIPRKAISWGDNCLGFFHKLLLDNKLKRRPKEGLINSHHY